MKPKEQVLRFLLGANTPQGFVSRFEGVADVEDGWRLLVIKGGPGSGKSTMMKRIAQSLAPEYGNMEMIHCSSDVSSLDGVVVPDLKFAIMDGTPPHAIHRSLNKMNRDSIAISGWPARAASQGIGTSYP